MGFWLGAGHEKDQAMIRSLELSALTPQYSGEGKGFENKLIISCAM